MPEEKKSMFISLKVTPTLLEKIDRLAASEKRTRSMMAQILIDEGFVVHSEAKVGVPA